MVAVYGTLPRTELPAQSRSKAARAVTVLAVLSLCAAAVVVLASSVKPTELYDPNNVQGVWASQDEAWNGINTVLPTAAGAWQDTSAASVGYQWHNPGSVTSKYGHTGYYDTTLHNGMLNADGTEMEVIPDNVNDAMGYDATLSGTNQFWGSRGGQSSEDPAPWSNNEPMTVNEMSDGGVMGYW